MPVRHFAVSSIPRLIPVSFSPIDDNLVNDERGDGSLDPRGPFVQARLGHGFTNFSKHPRRSGEPLSGGGKWRSGLDEPFLKVGDCSLQACSNLAASRRRARPRWWWSTSTIPTSRITSTGRCEEEQKVVSLVTGSTRLQPMHLDRGYGGGLHQLRIGRHGDDGFDPKKNPAHRRARVPPLPPPLVRRVPDSYYVHRVIFIFVASGARPRSTSRSAIPTGTRTAYAHGIGPELEQFRSGHRQEYPERAVEADGAPWQLTARTTGETTKYGSVSAPELCGTRIGARRLVLSADPGHALFTPPSTTGTPASRAGRSGPRTPARSTCSSTTRPATWPRST